MTTASYILWIVLGFIFGLSTLILGFVFGEDFHFNLTKRMQDETKLLDFCISNTTIKIPDVEKFCALSYGGLNTSYGEQIK